MYCFVMRPAALPFEYFAFIQKTGPAAVPVLDFVQRSNRGEIVAKTEILKFINEAKSPIVYAAQTDFPTVRCDSTISHLTDY